ncbi:BREX system P-loop protein BrxC [Lysinibacillus sp. JK80]|uniref:BREX system P-loop protein BrxC n=1 Tax=Lysinibacillus sp. JK80 TaxID=2749809 RepID=UPI0022B94422|nr:BREX system P-loop protein BrxC [Lysinibacillus sp. JK80]WBF57650.1 BREX system P-loop protein BrxC [Lysinibacillus sp. JK80]
MIIKDIFREDINRPINGVVQAGQTDEETIYTELREYVVTDEILNSLKDFYKNYEDVYKVPTKDVGVWISGFFGSGKSHFLKILSYLLDNKEIKGRAPFEYFEDKIKDDALLAAMRRIGAKESDALLFNVGSEASTNATRGSKESIIEIILRIFNEHVGYSTTLWVADFERQLEREGKYLAFTNKIEELYGETWQDYRLKFRMRFGKMIAALTAIGYDETSADFMVRNAQKEFSISAKELGKLIAEYCESKGSDYRLVFLIDEVGQYIGMDNNLMLDLQNAVEEIGAATNGQAWIAITSQESIKSVANVVDTTSFSKIQGRFKTRINLSSSNTDEVLKRRLLEKNETAKKTLETIYEPNEQLIRNRLSFDKEKTQYRSSYRTTEEFVAIYPFVPYQVELLQAVLEKIGIHGEGSSYASRGERSLLKSFQDAAIKHNDDELGTLVTMAEFYPTIRQHLESTIVQTITKAESRAANNEGLYAADVDILKVLYLIKGIDHIQATPSNIVALLLTRIDAEQNETAIKESLNRLEQTMFIEKHADGTYSFLSDEEQEINSEIRNVDVNASTIKANLAETFFSEMYDKAKFANSKGFIFEYNKRFDNYSKSNMKYPLTMQVITGSMSSAEAALQSVEGQMVVYLNEELVAEAEEAIRLSEQIRRYVSAKRNPSTTQAQHRIYDTKLASVDDYDKKAKKLLAKACESATFYIQMQERTFRGSFEKQVNDAFEMLVQNTYKYLEYIDEPIPMKNVTVEWKRIYEQGIQQDLLNTTGNIRAYNEVLRYLEELIRLHQKPSLKEVLDKYSQVPYGWTEIDTIGILLALIHDSKLKFTITDELFSPTIATDFYTKLNRATDRDKIRVVPEIEVDPKVRREFIALYKDLFGRLDSGDSYQDFAEALNAAMDKHFSEPLQNITDCYQRGNSAQYPYPEYTKVVAISNDIKRLMQIRDPEQLVMAFIDAEDELIDAQEQLEGLVGFYLNAPIKRFDEAVQYLKSIQNDLTHTQSDEVKMLKKQLTDILVKSEPYRDIPLIPSIIEKLQQAIAKEVVEHKKAVGTQITQLEQKLSELQEYYSNNEAVSSLIAERMPRFTNAQQQLLEADSLIMIQMKLSELRDVTAQIQQAAKQKEDELLRVVKKPVGETPPGDTPPRVVREKGTKVISSQTLRGMLVKTEIQTQSELDDLLAELKQQLLKELKDNTLKFEL